MVISKMDKGEYKLLDDFNKGGKKEIMIEK